MNKILSFLLALAVLFGVPSLAYAQASSGGDEPILSSSDEGIGISLFQEVPSLEILLSSIASSSPALALDDISQRILDETGDFISPGASFEGSMVLTNDTSNFYVLDSPLLFVAFCENVPPATQQQIREEIYEHGFVFTCTITLSSGEEIAFQPPTPVGLMENVAYDSNNVMQSELSFTESLIPFEPGDSCTVTWEFSMPGDVGNIFQGADNYYFYNLAASQAGKTVVRYVDASGNELLPSITLFGALGNEYTAPEETIEGFELLRVEGEATGTFATEETEVTFVYSQVQEPAPPNPPIPGSETPEGLARTSDESWLVLAIAAFALLCSVSVFGYRRTFRSSQ